MPHHSCSDAGLKLTHINVKVRDWSSAITLVREGLGITIVPKSTLPETKKGIRVIPLHPVKNRHFGLVVAPGRTPSYAASRLIDLAQSQSNGMNSDKRKPSSPIRP